MLPVIRICLVSFPLQSLMMNGLTCLSQVKSQQEANSKSMQSYGILTIICETPNKVQQTSTYSWQFSPTGYWTKLSVRRVSELFYPFKEMVSKLLFTEHRIVITHGKFSRELQAKNLWETRGIALMENPWRISQLNILKKSMKMLEQTTWKIPVNDPWKFHKEGSEKI